MKATHRDVHLSSPLSFGILPAFSYPPIQYSTALAVVIDSKAIQWLNLYTP